MDNDFSDAICSFVLSVDGAVEALRDGVNSASEFSDLVDVVDVWISEVIGEQPELHKNVIQRCT